MMYDEENPDIIENDEELGAIEESIEDNIEDEEASSDKPSGDGLFNMSILLDKLESSLETIVEADRKHFKFSCEGIKYEGYPVKRCKTNSEFIFNITKPEESKGLKKIDATKFVWAAGQK